MNLTWTRALRVRGVFAVLHYQVHHKERRRLLAGPGVSSIDAKHIPQRNPRKVNSVRRQECAGWFLTVPPFG